MTANGSGSPAGCSIVDCYCGLGPVTCAGCGTVTTDSWNHPEVPGVECCESCVDAYYAEVNR